MRSCSAWRSSVVASNTAWGHIVMACTRLESHPTLQPKVWKNGGMMAY